MTQFISKYGFLIYDDAAVLMLRCIFHVARVTHAHAHITLWIGILDFTYLHTGTYHLSWCFIMYLFPQNYWNGTKLCRWLNIYKIFVNVTERSVASISPRVSHVFLFSIKMLTNRNLVSYRPNQSQYNDRNTYIYEPRQKQNNTEEPKLRQANRCSSDLNKSLY
jgi:hypothetical protein